MAVLPPCGVLILACPCILAIFLIASNAYLRMKDPEGPWRKGEIRGSARGSYTGAFNPGGLGTFTYDEPPTTRKKFGDGLLPNQMTWKCPSHTGERCGGWDLSWKPVSARSCSSPHASCDEESGVCRCKGTTCADTNGNCVPWVPPDHTATRPDADKILCPVLTAIYNAGILRPDAYGRVTRDHLRDALYIGTGVESAEFQATGVAMFHKHDHFETTSKRCFGLCYFRKMVMGEENKLDEDVRYLNIFTMGDSGATGYVKHGSSTGVRETPTSRSDPNNKECGGVFPCRARFDRLVAPFFDGDGRMYEVEMLRMMKFSQEHGDRFNLLWGSSRHPFLQLWQQDRAVMGWLEGFGRDDGDGRGLYLTLEDAEDIFLRGHLPRGYIRRWWGGGAIPFWFAMIVLAVFQAEVAHYIAFFVVVLSTWAFRYPSHFPLHPLFWTRGSD